MLIPTHFNIHGQVLQEILKVTKKHHNNMDLGEAVRSIIQDYKEGKYNPPSDIELDKGI